MTSLFTRGCWTSALLLVLSFSTSSNAALLLSFGQNGTGTQPFSATNPTSTTTLLSATNAPVTVTQYVLGGPDFNAFFNFTATSVGAASATPQPNQNFNGFFTISSLAGGGGSLYLRGDFTGLLGIGSGSSFSLQANDAVPHTLVFTSGTIPANALLSPTSFGLTLTGVAPGVSIANNTISAFNANLSGSADATVVGQIVPLPEPASLAIWTLSGLGIGLVRFCRRKRS